MRRGFKALAERNALAARTALNLKSGDRLDPFVYAEHLKVIVLDFSKLKLSRGAADQLTKLDGDAWSAMTLRQNGSHFIVVNPSHTKPRIHNDLMHELAHIELNHEPARVDLSPSKVLLLSDYSDEQEQEADWHAAALLAPRDALIALRARGKNVVQIAEHYQVSTQLCEWRLNATGIESQLRRTRAYTG